MAELFHECGIAAVYHLPNRETSRLAPSQGAQETSRLMPRLLLDIQNRGQLAAGMTTFNPNRKQLIDTHRDVGTVTEVFHLSHPEPAEMMMQKYAGPAAIGHVRYATCGQDDRSYAQPFERHHIQRSKWFSFAFNGQLANYPQLRQEILSHTDFHLARETDTEILMHLLCQELSGDQTPDLLDVLSGVTPWLDGAYNIVFLNAQGDMFVARDPLGIRPLCFAIEGPMFAAASESVALSQLGFRDKDIHSLPPGGAVIIQNGEIDVLQFAPSPKRSHCFFEWIYFANVASTLDDRSVYMTRKSLGEELARLEDVPIDDDTIVVPVPDTAKAAAASMAFELGVPCLEGLMRNRYVGRTFIEGTNRADKARLKYTPLPEVLRGKRVLVVEDTIVRSTTMRALVSQLRERGGAREVHVRVACPPIVAPCFYGIDMSTISELFAPKFMDGSGMTPQIEQQMAKSLNADSLRYLPIDSIARSIDLPRNHLCQACIDSNYPTTAGTDLYQIALGNEGAPAGTRTYDTTESTATRT
ncbi:MAG TPA: amidophosphoribosyltransferase [Planctomycetaceae bacterium]|nr:amidophosphoribosyltransferase [Planctomycetaceae bacterium]HAA49780.1 amidophosphoribosyltransferase [Planctomycetaceae bacterium]HCK52343.1 amidophosphoribosyltransferase [Planctomycetaceae bacterium]|tara:strand:- start:573 stop:2156 length:1584 start_codon:yes stop_codon:yes gene_type:complete